MQQCDGSDGSGGTALFVTGGLEPRTHYESKGSEIKLHCTDQRSPRLKKTFYAIEVWASVAVKQVTPLSPAIKTQERMNQNIKGK